MSSEISIEIQDEPETSSGFPKDAQYTNPEQRIGYFYYFYYVYYVVQYYVLGTARDERLGYVEKRVRSSRRKGLIGLAAGFCCFFLVVLVVAAIVVLALIPVYLGNLINYFLVENIRK